jgi:hypothetical protein
MTDCVILGIVAAVASTISALAATYLAVVTIKSTVRNHRDVEDRHSNNSAS